MTEPTRYYGKYRGIVSERLVETDGLQHMDDPGMVGI